MKFTLIFLTLNEIEGLKNIFHQIPLKCVDEIFAVDGGSTDGTLEFYKKHKIRVVIQKSKGRGEAFRIAMREAKGDVVIFFSPDGNENSGDIPKFKKYFLERNADIVIASRMMKGAVNEEDNKNFKWRKWANNTFNLVINILFRRKGKYITDSINGFRAIKKTVFEKLKPTSTGYTIEYEMTIKAFKNKMNIYEFPTIEGARIGGESYAKSLPTGLKFLKVLAKETLESFSNILPKILLGLIVLFSIFIRFEGIYWNIKDNPKFEYSIHIDEVYKVEHTLGMDIAQNGMSPTAWLMIKGAGYPNLAKLMFDLTNNPAGESIFKTIYGYELNTTQGHYLFFRTVTALFSMMLILATYKLTNLLSKNRYTGVLAAFFVSTIFGSLQSSVIFKSDITLTTFLTLMLISLIQYYKKPDSGGKKYLYLSGVFYGFACAVKYNAFFSGLLFPLTYLIQRLTLKKVNLKSYVFTAIISIISTFVLSPYMFLNLHGFTEGLKVQKYYQTNRPLQFEEFGFQPWTIIIHLLQSSLGPVLLILSLCATVYIVYQIIKKKNYVYILPLGFLLIYFILSSINTWIVVRYTIPFYPILVAFASIFLIKIYDFAKVKGRIYHYLSIFIISTILLFHFIYFMAFSKFITETTTTVEAANWINTNIEKESSIIQFQKLGSEPPIVYGFDHKKTILLSGDELNIFIDTFQTIEGLQNAEYVIIDERSYRDYYRLTALKYEKEKVFFDSIIDSEEYELVQKFEIQPKFGGITFDEGFLPQDTILANPDISIYKKIKL